MIPWLLDGFYLLSNGIKNPRDRTQKFVIPPCWKQIRHGSFVFSAHVIKDPGKQGFVYGDDLILILMAQLVTMICIFCLVYLVKQSTACSSAHVKICWVSWQRNCSPLLVQVATTEELSVNIKEGLIFWSFIWTWGKMIERNIKV